jgi:hypothetical protein
LAREEDQTVGGTPRQHKRDVVFACTDTNASAEQTTHWFATRQGLEGVQFSPDVPSSGITHNFASEATPLIRKPDGP